MKKIILTGLIILSTSCEQTPSTKVSQSWHGSMRGLATSLTAVMPQLVASSDRIRSSDHNKLKSAIDDLQTYSTNLNSTQLVIPSKDPSLKFVAQDFQKELEKVKEHSKAASLEEMQKDLRGLTRYCVACHTKTAAGSSQFTQSMEQSVLSLNDLQKGNFYMAMRQYEKALVHLENGLTNRDWAMQNPEAWNRGAMQLLAVTVRVHNNPNLTFEMISRLFDSKAYPKDLERAARVWRQDAKEWSKNGPAKGDLQGLPELLKTAKEKESKLKHSGLILNLRAQARLNLYLKSGGLSAKREQAVLYYSGILGQRLENLNFASFPNSYFKACVEIAPNTKLGQLCRKSL